MINDIINQHISIREACILTGMCAQTLRKLGDQQKIKCYKTHSGQRKFDKGSLMELVKSAINDNNLIKDDNYCVINSASNSSNASGASGASNSSGESNSSGASYASEASDASYVSYSSYTGYANYISDVSNASNASNAKDAKDANNNTSYSDGFSGESDVASTQSNKKEYLFYDTYENNIEKNYIELYIKKNPSVIVINNIDSIIDICMENKNININILTSFYRNKNEYNILKKIIHKCGNKITVI